MVIKFIYKLDKNESIKDCRGCCREGNGTPLQYSCLENPMDGAAWEAAVHGVAKSRTQLSNFTFIFHFHALEKEVASHSSVLAWRIPGTGEPDGLPSMELHRVGHDWSDLAAAAAAEDVGCGLALHVAKCYSWWCLCWHFCNWWLHLFISHPNKRRRLHNSKQVVENSKNQENYFDEAIKTYLIYIFTYLIFDQGFGLSEIQKNLTFNQ